MAAVREHFRVLAITSYPLLQYPAEISTVGSGSILPDSVMFCSYARGFVRPSRLASEAEQHMQYRF